MVASKARKVRLFQCPLAPEKGHNGSQRDANQNPIGYTGSGFLGHAIGSAERKTNGCEAAWNTLTDAVKARSPRVTGFTSTRTNAAMTDAEYLEARNARYIERQNAATAAAAETLTPTELAILKAAGLR